MAAVTTFIADRRGNIIDLEQDVDIERAVFFMRVTWSLAGFSTERKRIDEQFAEVVGRRFEMTWALSFSDARPKMALLVSRLSHCLYDVLARWSAGEWRVDIPLIIGNHDRLRSVAERFGVAYHHIPVTAENRAQAESRTR